MAAVAELTDRIESEWQFDAPDLGALRRWMADQPLGPRLWFGIESTLLLSDTYCDTDDWRFHRAGYALRIREAEGRTEATMKALAGGDEAVRRRREITVPFEGGRPEALPRALGSFGERVRALAGRRPVRPLVEVRTRRQSFLLHLDGHLIGELALDETLVHGAPDHTPVRMSRVEVEVDADQVAAVEPFVTALRDACGLEPAEQSKYQAALQAVGLRPATLPELGPTEIADTLTIGEVAFAALRVNAVALLENEAGTRLGEESEPLHDMRVAVRRLRVGLKLFADVLPRRAAMLRPELRWLGAALAPVRDLDVQLVRLQAWGAAAEYGNEPALQALAALLRDRRATARRRMLVALDSRRYERLVGRLVTVLQRGPLRRSAAARRPVLAAAPGLIARCYRRMTKLGDRIDEDSPPSDYHALRIRGKRLRYALTCHAEVYGKPIRKLTRAVVALLDILGAHQDAEVAITRLRDLCRHNRRGVRTDTAFVIGALVERCDRQAVELRRRFPKAYRKATGRGWKGLRRAMEARSEPAPKAPRSARRQRTSTIRTRKSRLTTDGTTKRAPPPSVPSPQPVAPRRHPPRRIERARRSRAHAH